MEHHAEGTARAMIGRQEITHFYFLLENRVGGESGDEDMRGTRAYRSLGAKLRFLDLIQGREIESHRGV